MKDSTKQILDHFARTTEEIYNLEELRERLESGRPLKIKYGVDVTAPFLHIGHAVNLWMMREMQEHGHIVQFLIGDFTTRVGDPTGKSKLRPVIPQDVIEANGQEFIRQVSAVLLTDPKVFEVRRNSEWFGAMATHEFLQLLAMVTHSKLIARDMFQRRIQAGDEIYMHEMLYPVLQGYDSKMLDDDLTIVGTDQLFNELMGRFFQEKFDQRPQVVMTTKITPGTDGVEKQSKSLGNYIALADTARDKFGKVMSIPDGLIRSYFEVYTQVDLAELEPLKVPQIEEPMKWKKRLAREIVARYHGQDVAAAEEDWFTTTFSKKTAPVDARVVAIAAPISWIELLRRELPDHSAGELRRLVHEGAVRIDGEKIKREMERAWVDWTGEGMVKVGKLLWFRLVRIPISIVSASFPDSAIGLDASAIIGLEAPTADGGGFASKEKCGAELASFRVHLRSGKVLFESVAFPGCYMRMDGRNVTQLRDFGSGHVNAQKGAGEWEEFTLHKLTNGNVRIESVAFPNCYLRMGKAEVNCQYTAIENGYEDFAMRPFNEIDRR
jgi:tyrosyl-tRNA synthetase